LKHVLWKDCAPDRSVVIKRHVDEVSIVRVEEAARSLGRGDQLYVATVIDAVIVSRSSALIAGEVMLEVFGEVAGVRGNLSSHPPDALSISLPGGG
jgi:hypothetical protein